MILNFEQFLINEAIERPEGISDGQWNAIKNGSKDYVSKSQFCLLYCLAKDEGDSKEMLEIMKIQPQFKEFSGINFHTFQRSLLKMQVGLGLKEAPHSADEPTPLINKYIEEFENMSKSERIELACECFDEEHVNIWNSKSELSKTKNADRQVKSKNTEKLNRVKIYQAISDYMRTLRDLDKSLKAVQKTYSDYTINQLKDIWTKR